MSLNTIAAPETHRAVGVRLREVARTFLATRRDGRDRAVLTNINLDVAPGEIIALIGASGCGKSTLLRQVGGLDTPTSGTVLVDETPVDGIDQRCAIAFQEARLLPWRTVQSNVALGLAPGTDRQRGRQRVRELLELVGLGECAGLRPRQISGGMAQRVSLARALARNPGVLLLDEPFGALDALTRLNMHDLLLDIHRAEPATIILVTHDVDEALYLADRIVLLGSAAEASEESSRAATIRRIEPVPGSRPRHRSGAALIELRQSLLGGLGVTSAP